MLKYIYRVAPVRIRFNQAVKSARPGFPGATLVDLIAFLLEIFMLTIWKFDLLIVDEQILNVPDESKILKIGIQNNELKAWILVDTKKTDTSTPKKIFIIGTGNKIYEECKIYIDTIMWKNFVWHVFIEDKNFLK